jgi:hypothetical protein
MTKAIMCRDLRRNVFFHQEMENVIVVVVVVVVVIVVVIVARGAAGNRPNLHRQRRRRSRLCIPSSPSLSPLSLLPTTIANNVVVASMDVARRHSQGKWHDAHDPPSLVIIFVVASLLEAGEG